MLQQQLVFEIELQCVDEAFDRTQLRISQCVAGIWAL